MQNCRNVGAENVRVEARGRGLAAGLWGGWAGIKRGLATIASPSNEGDVMIGRETRVLSRHYLEQGMGKVAVARQLGISERTVYRWIAAGHLDREVDEGAVEYGPRRPQPSKLGPYKEIIGTRLAEYPELSVVRLYKEVRAAGYEGGYDQVKRYVRAVRPQPPDEPVQWFETPPGHQGQVGPRGVQHPLGQAARADRGPRVLAADVAPVLRAADDGGGDGGSGVGFPVLPGRALGTPVQPDEGRDRRGQPGHRWAAGREPRVCALQS